MSCSLLIYKSGAHAAAGLPEGQQGKVGREGGRILRTDGNEGSMLKVRVKEEGRDAVTTQ
jgi:hypothetical protein